MSEPCGCAIRPTVAVVTGHHPFDVPAFHALLRSLQADCYPQHMEDYASAAPEVRSGYDVVVFYNMHLTTPRGDGPWYEAGMKAALEDLGTSSQGIVVLHHAILAFPEWELWSQIVGISDRSFGFHIGESIRVQVTDPQHPITRGLTDWDMVDETYTMADPGPDSHALLKVEHPRSMKIVAWTRQYRKARVLCMQLGHDASAYGHASFRQVLSRGVLWCAGAI